MPSMKPRVPLYGCFPLGVGTPFIESLTGFVTRLALARQLRSSAVFDRLIRPIVSSEVVRDSDSLTRFLATGAVRYDGLGPLASALVLALERLTGLRNLSRHTLLPWAGLLGPVNNRALWWGRKRWCGSCLAEWRRRGVVPWEPLLWRVAAVSRCPVHGTSLSAACSRCAAPQAVVQEVVPFGVCRRCRGDLETDDPSVRTDMVYFGADEVARWECWTSVAMGRMLASRDGLSLLPTATRFVRLLQESLRLPGFGSVRGLAHYLGLSSSSVAQWIRGRRRANLPCYLAVCMRLGVDPVDVALSRERLVRRSSRCPWAKAKPPGPLLHRDRRGDMVVGFVMILPAGSGWVGDCETFSLVRNRVDLHRRE